MRGRIPMAIAMVALAAALSNQPAAGSGHSWKVTIPPEGEPGEALVVSGVVYAEDGVTPVPGIVLQVYHTDAKGRYSIDGKDERNPRLKGRMRTDAQGRYEFRTILPASYSGNRWGGHIHASVEGAGYERTWIDEYLFREGPAAASDDRFSAVLSPIAGNGGVLRAVRDIRLPARKGR